MKKEIEKLMELEKSATRKDQRGVWRKKKQFDKLLEEVKVFHNPKTKKTWVSGGALIILTVKKWTPIKRGQSHWKVFIEQKKKMLKRKYYPAQDWIDGATKIMNFEKEYGVKLDYNLYTDKITMKVIK